MTLILPNRVDGLDEVISKWDSSSLNRIQWLMDEVEVRVLLPKFAFDTEAQLKDTLTEVNSSQQMLDMSRYESAFYNQFHSVLNFSWASSRFSPCGRRSHCWHVESNTKIVYRCRVYCRNLELMSTKRAAPFTRPPKSV